MACPSETRLQAFVDGDLDPGDIEALSQHLDDCDECRMLVGAVQPVSLDDAVTVERVGRYVLRRVIGRGGMGVVYEAVDPELHRDVALKVLRTDLGAGPRRLLGEAQSMAKLSHPNVVAVHDVGRDGDRVFIVMTLVKGVSLRHWLVRERRSIAVIVEAFLQAAEGLRAAHDAGLVHRDFKAENVFVSDRGEVLVGDFGLAVSGALEGAAAAEGTLATMAPEQRRGETADARSDQYSFCIVLARALDESLEGRAGIPRWLEAVIARGTKDDPSARFASMNEVIRALTDGPRRARARRLAVAFALAFAALGLGGLAIARARAPEPLAACRGEAATAQVWDAEAKKRVEGAFRATKSPLADDTWQRARVALDAYAAKWRDSRTRTCDADTPETRAATEPRLQCLADRLETFRAVTASLEKTDAPMLEQVPSMLQILPRIEACDDAKESAREAPAPPAAKAAAVEAAKKKTAVASATISAGRYAEGLALADDAWQAANATGFLPMMAEAYLWVGTAHGRLGHGPEAEQALEHAVSSASASQAISIAIRAWIQLMHFVGYEGKRYDDGFRWAEYARAALEGTAGAHELEAERMAWQRAMLLDLKRYDEALAIARKELALVELELGPTHRRAASALDGLAGGLVGQCKARDALAPQERACAILEKDLGAAHPQLALCLGNLASLHAALGEHERALGLKRRALAMFAAAPGHPNHVGMAQRNLVRSLLELGRLDEAAAELEVVAGKGGAQETSVLVLRGELRRREGKNAEALADHVAAVERTATLDASKRIDPLVALAETDLALGRPADAAANAGRAASFVERVYGARSCRLAEPLRLEAEGLLATPRAGEALPLAERALGVLDGAQLDPRTRERVVATIEAARAKAR